MSIALSRLLCQLVTKIGYQLAGGGQDLGNIGNLLQQDWFLGGKHQAQKFYMGGAKGPLLGRAKAHVVKIKVVLLIGR